MALKSDENIILRKISADDFKKLYKEQMMKDFPPDELRPLWAFQPLFEKGIYNCYVFFAGSKRIAYGAIVHSEVHQCALLDYFAVDETYRGQGIGTVFLKALLSELDCKGVLIEVETIKKNLTEHENLIRRKRIRFYKRLGALVKRVSGVVFGVEYQLMYLPLKRDYKAFELLEIIQDMYAEMVPKTLFEKEVRYFES